MIGIQKFQINQNSCSYFIKRPFGNLLLFADELDQESGFNLDLVSSYGGLYKTILESSSSINTLHQKLFIKFGACVLCPMQNELFDQRVRLENIESFSDPNVNIIYKYEKNFIIIKQDEKNILFVGKAIKLINEKEVLYKDKNIIHEIFELKEKYKIDLVYFTSYKKDSALTFKKKSLFERLMSVFNNF